MRLSEVPFTHSFLEQLPETQVYSLVQSEAVPQPRLLAWSEELAQLLNLDQPELAPNPDLEILAGNRVPESARPYAVRYGGHQFGHWAGQLGDGRALTLGTLTDREGRSWEFQLKGAGLTPYSRRGDGRAVLRSSLREFVASEAMHALKVPTTRSLSLVATGAPVLRDMFYDGNPQLEPGAICSRQAPTFVRFGNFQIHAAQNEAEALRKLVRWTIQNHFPHIAADSPDAVATFFRDVCERTARLIVEWLRVGFVHGVMNTDNMSILGLTTDYGPFGFLDTYEPDFTPNTTDLPGRRYCFGRQASIALWNCERLAEALSPLLKDKSELEVGLKNYVRTYETTFLQMMAGKLGLENLRDEDDIQLLADLDQLLQGVPTDMTLFFRSLSRPGDSWTHLQSAFYQDPSAELGRSWQEWLARLKKRQSHDQLGDEARVKKMERHNPWLIPRNYLLYSTIQKAEAGDLTPLQELLAALKDPYREDARNAHLAQKRPDWAKTQPGSSTLSCSS